MLWAKGLVLESEELFVDLAYVLHYVWNRDAAMSSRKCKTDACLSAESGIPTVNELVESSGATGYAIEPGRTGNCDWQR